MYFVPIPFHFLGELIPKASVMVNLQWYHEKIPYSVTFFGSLFPIRMVLLNCIVTEYYIYICGTIMYEGQGYFTYSSIIVMKDSLNVFAKKDQ